MRAGKSEDNRSGQFQRCLQVGSRLDVELAHQLVWSEGKGGVRISVASGLGDENGSSPVNLGWDQSHSQCQLQDFD